MAVSVPVVGCFTADQPIMAQENISKYFAVPAQKVKSDQAYMLAVKGDSVKDAGIFDGGLILVRKQNTAEDNEVVVAMTEDNEATVKRFFKESGYFSSLTGKQRVQAYYCAYSEHSRQGNRDISSIRRKHSLTKF